VDTGFIEVFLDGVSLHTFCEGCIVPAGDILVEPFSTQFTAATTGPVPFELTFKRRFPNPLDSFPVFHKVFLIIDFSKRPGPTHCSRSGMPATR
jgi:hypothetical protein